MLFGPKYSPTPTATEPRSSSTTSNTGVVEVSGQEQSARKRGIRYRAFGKRFTLSGSNPARRDPSFQNRTYDAGLGIYDYRNRSFDPATGRFLQRDPVLGGDSLFNPYVFPGNNPVGNVDPMGLGWERNPKTKKWEWKPKKGEPKNPDPTVPATITPPTGCVDLQIQSVKPQYSDRAGAESTSSIIGNDDLFTLVLKVVKKPLPAGKTSDPKKAKVIGWLGRLSDYSAGKVRFSAKDRVTGRGSEVVFRKESGEVLPATGGLKGACKMAGEVRGSESHNLIQMYSEPKFLEVTKGDFKLYAAWHDRFTNTVVYQERDREAVQGRYLPEAVKKWATDTYYLIIPYTVVVVEEGVATRLDSKRKFKVGHVVGKVHTGYFVLKLAGKKPAHVAALSPRTGFLIVRGAQKEALLKKWAAYDAKTIKEQKEARKTKPEEARE